MENLALYEKLRAVPQEAKKTIGAGRLKGFTDVNPMWRIKALTEAFGPCGVGWWYTIDNKELVHDEITKTAAAFVDVTLFYIDPETGETSHGIPGTGGASFVAQERSGPYMSDECVDGDCEVLTPEGWVAFKRYAGTEIAQFDKNTSEISFTKPTRVIHKKSSDLYDKGGVIMTAHHRNLVYSRSSGGRVILMAEDFAKKAFLASRNGYGRSKTYQDIKCGFYGTAKRLTPAQQIGIMIACDGTLYRENANGDIYWRVEFGKQRKIEKAKQLLQNAGIKFHETLNKRKNGTTTVSYTFNLNGTYKDYRSFLPLGNYPDLWDEIISWDGCKTCGAETFSTAKKESAEYLQTLLALSGETVTISARTRKSKKHHELYVLYKKKHGTGSCGFKRCNEELDVYCVEVPTTFFLIRKNGEIYVTGNCYKMALTDALSVAAKSLGLAADVYFDKDRTKYTAAAPEDKLNEVLSKAPPLPEFRCEECGELLKPYISAKTGKQVGLREHAEAVRKACGKVLCRSCYDKFYPGR